MHKFFAAYRTFSGCKLLLVYYRLRIRRALALFSEEAEGCYCHSLCTAIDSAFLILNGIWLNSENALHALN